MTTISPEAYKELVKPKAKYKNVKTVIDGIEFDSKGEAMRWLELKELEKMGLISNLQRQVPFSLQPKFKASDGKSIRKMEYIVDFTYTHLGKPVAEDFKGCQTEASKLKIKLFKFRYPGYIFRISRMK